MSMTIEAAPLAAEAQMVEAVVTAISVTIFHKALALLERVASISCPSIGGTSLSAVSPDNYLRKELALAGA